MTSKQALLTEVDGYIKELSYLTEDIQKSLQTKPSVTFQSEIKELQEEAESLNREFQDQEKQLQAMGGKTRHQTLQEFVILFFYISLFIITIVVTMFVYITRQSVMDAFKIFGLMLFGIFLISGFLIRYA